MSVFSPHFIVPTTGSLLSPYYSLSIKHNRRTTKIIMKMFTQSVTTEDFPHTFSILQSAFPQVFNTQCFNEFNLPFSEEVKKTELGHLFEHILIEMLYLLKIEQGQINPCVKGYTDWDWVREEQGTFRITINSGREDMDLFREAVQEALVIMEYIMRKGERLGQRVVS